jgi:hypothetical protein
MLTSGALMALFTQSALADPMPQSGVLTVQAMAKMESDAIQELRQQAERERIPIRPPSVLLAIVGVAPDLKASVLVDGSPVLFQQGLSKPVHGPTNRRHLKLRHITPPCVFFVDRGRSRRLCLRPKTS